MRLDDLGPRICLLGPSNRGESTLPAAIAGARWIIDGNCSTGLSQRLARATGGTLLDVSPP